MITELLELVRGKFGPIGTLGIRRRRRVRPPREIAARNFVAASALLIGIAVPLAMVATTDVGAALRWSGFLVGYLACAFFVHPRPNTDDEDSMIDHPFRISDDLNRGLGYLFLALLPGRFIAESMIVFFTWRTLPTIDEILADESLDDPGRDIFE